MKVNLNNLTDLDINKVNLTGNEKRFSDLRTNFYKTLAEAESYKLEEGYKDKRKGYTNFFRNLNKKQIEIPKDKEMKAEKKALYDFIIDDTLDDAALTYENKRQLVREIKQNFKNLEDEISNVYDQKNKNHLHGLINRKPPLGKPLVPKDRETYIQLRDITPSSNPFKDHSQFESSEREHRTGLDSYRLKEDFIKGKGMFNNDDNFELKKFQNERIKMHLRNIQSTEYTLDDLDCFPDDINDIYKMREFTNPIQELKDSTPICENLRKYGLIEHSILKQNYFYLDESQDINFYKDLSSYSRRVFKDPK